jgi:hypothetical protein
MSSHYKAFAIVLLVSLFSFWLVRSTFTKFMSDTTFVRRRNLWLLVTTSAFLIPNFWGYMAVAGTLIAYEGRRDPNPAALYLFLLLAIPPFEQTIPGFGLVNKLFALDHFRLLSLVLVIPAVFKLRNTTQARQKHQASGWLLPDIFLVIYGVLQVALYAPYISITDSLRGAFMLVLDVLLPYYLLSRSCTQKFQLVDALATLALAAMVLAPLAIFETAKGWLLYSSISDYWRIDSTVIGYLMRGDYLRAQVTSGQSIILGNFYAVVLGLWLYLQASARLTSQQRWLGTAAVAGGMLAAFSRGPWVGAVLCVFVYFVAAPNGIKNIAKLVGISAALSAITLASPWGSQVIDYLPFVGTVDEGNVTYRQEVIDRSWMVIKQNPFFGSPYFINQMEDLRTGQGIIDLLNVYLSIGMAYGLVTLGAFLLFLLLVSLRCWKFARANLRLDPDTARLGAGLLASLMGTLLIIYTVSNYLSVPYLYMGLAALMVAYSRLPMASMTETPQRFGR